MFLWHIDVWGFLGDTEKSADKNAKRISICHCLGSSEMGGLGGGQKTWKRLDSCPGTV